MLLKPVKDWNGENGKVCVVCIILISATFQSYCTELLLIERERSAFKPVCSKCRCIDVISNVYPAVYK